MKLINENKKIEREENINKQEVNNNNKKIKNVI